MSEPGGMPAPERSCDLAALRKRRGLSLDDIANATKISVGYLRAIEEGRFERLPGGIYDISYLRQYARVVDCDEVQLIRRYQQKMGLLPRKDPSEAGGKRRPGGWLRNPAATLRTLF